MEEEARIVHMGSLRVLLRDTMPFIRKVGGKMQVLRVLAATILGASAGRFLVSSRRSPHGSHEVHAAVTAPPEAGLVLLIGDPSLERRRQQTADGISGAPQIEATLCCTE